MGANGPVVLKKDFVDDSLKYHIDLEKTIKIPDCPVRILTGSGSESGVNRSEFRKLMNSLSTDDVEMVYLKDESKLGRTDEAIHCFWQLERLIVDHLVKGGEEDQLKYHENVMSDFIQ